MRVGFFYGARLFSFDGLTSPPYRVFPSTKPWDSPVVFGQRASRNADVFRSSDGDKNEGMALIVPSRSWPPVLSWFITKLYHRTVANFKGYSPPLDSNIDAANNNKGDLNEAFGVGWEEMEEKQHDKKRENDGAMAGANLWPSDDSPGFRGACLEY